jgi:myo-inositol-1(or 4)-monophosphatase
MSRGEIDLIKQALLKAGEAVLQFSPTDGLVHKEGRGNPVTAADLASEKIIIDLIHETFPEDQILAEETAGEIKDQLNADNLWVIDPIDGTNNFSHGRNYSAISIGYVEKGVIMAAGVYNPFTKELFQAERGKGALLNGNSIEVSALDDLSHATVASDNSSFPEGTRRNLQTMLKIPETPWFLMRGSAVLIMCDVAAARVDLYFHTFLKPWDNAAAFLIAEEAGAEVVGFDGKPVNFLSDTAVVGNKNMVKQFLDSL